MKHKAALLLALLIGALFAHEARGAARCEALQERDARSGGASTGMSAPTAETPLPGNAATVAADAPRPAMLKDEPVVPEARPRPANWRALIPGSLR